MSEFNAGGWRRLTPGELVSRGFSATSERRLNPVTGETISRREYEGIRLSAVRGQPVTLSQVTRERRLFSLEGERARALGFSSLAQARSIQSNEMYEAVERMYQLHAGGIPLEDIREFKPIANEFNRAVANVFRSREWVIRPHAQYQKYGFGRGRARRGRNQRALFELIGWDYDDDEEVDEKLDWLRHY